MFSLAITFLCLIDFENKLQISLEEKESSKDFEDKIKKIINQKFKKLNLQ